MSDTATAVGSDHGAPEAAEAEKKKRKTEECVDAPASEGDAASKPTPDDVAVGQSTSEPVFGVFLFFFSLSLPANDQSKSGSPLFFPANTFARQGDCSARSVQFDVASLGDKKK